MKQGAEIIGYISDVKIGGIESTNCRARSVNERDTHIELVVDPVAAAMMSPSIAFWLKALLEGAFCLSKLFSNEFREYLFQLL